MTTATEKFSSTPLAEPHLSTRMLDNLLFVIVLLTFGLPFAAHFLNYHPALCLAIFVAGWFLIGTISFIRLRR